MKFEERALCFTCNGSRLFGILSLPERALSRGVVIVVGGPQYRAGSHRQFVLLARYLAARGVPVMRFDYRGMGDSEGDMRQFEDVEDDIRHAIDKFYVEVPAIKEVVMWGLCDAACAVAFYAHRDPRVSGVVLLNPWVRTNEGAAKAHLKHYYLSRLLGRELWQKIFLGRFRYRVAARSFFSMIGAALPDRSKRFHATQTRGGSDKSCNPAPLPARMFDGLNRFNGKVLLILSGNDLTAKEFSDLVAGSRKWRNLLSSARVRRHDLPKANHTFSRREWRDQIATWTREWTLSW